MLKVNNKDTRITLIDGKTQKHVVGIINPPNIGKFSGSFLSVKNRTFLNKFTKLEWPLQTGYITSHIYHLGYTLLQKLWQLNLPQWWNPYISVILPLSQEILFRKIQILARYKLYTWQIFTFSKTEIETLEK